MSNLKTKNMKTMDKNMFLSALTSKDCYTENGALSNSSTGSALIDQFGKAGNYRGRIYTDVFNEQSLIWDENAELALRFPFYLRLITRKTKINNNNVTEKPQSGQGARDESFKRLLWIAQNHPEQFYNNIWLLPIVGSWKDVWTIMYLDITLNLNVVNHEVMFTLLAQGMKLGEHVELIKKFMPRIKSGSKCTTEWTKTTNKLAKEFADFMAWSYADYNKFKASGTAHEFQKLMCSKQYDKINWNLIPGRALSLISSSKFLENHSLTQKYEEWLMEQPVAKFTGYAFDLAKIYRKYNQYDWYNKNKNSMPSHVRMTLNKQFEQLLALGKENGAIKGNVWCALDTSGSMTALTSAGVSALDVCVSLGIYFSSLNEGSFNKKVIMFDSTSRVKQLSGDFCDMMSQVPMNAMGCTNFGSVCDEIVRIRREHPEIPLEEFPTTLLVVSDMQFNACNRSYDYNKHTWVEETSNYDDAKRKLAEAFPQEFVDNFKFIWWDCISRKGDFPATMNDGGAYFFSGFDGNINTTLLGGNMPQKKDGTAPTMEEVVNAALSQEILLNVKM